MTWKIKTGFLWKLSGRWEKNSDDESGIWSESQTNSECDHVVFWQESESVFGSYVLTEEDSPPDLNWGSAEKVVPESPSLIDARPLLDADEAGVGAWILEVDSDGEVTLLECY